MKMTGYILAALIGVAVGFFMGHTYAHNLIAEECSRLGGFFVGRRVFKCERVETVPSALRYPDAPPNPHRRNIQKTDEPDVPMPSRSDQHS